MLLHEFLTAVVLFIVFDIVGILYNYISSRVKRIVSDAESEKDSQRGDRKLYFPVISADT